MVCKTLKVVGVKPTKSKGENSIMKNYEVDLTELEEMLPLESPSCIIGPWFFVHQS